MDNILKIIDETILQMEENSMECTKQSDSANAEMYARMADGARCVKQTLEKSEEMQQLKKVITEREHFLAIAYNAITLGQLDEQYSESKLIHELSCSKEEFQTIMES